MESNGEWKVMIDKGEIGEEQKGRSEKGIKRNENERNEKGKC